MSPCAGLSSRAPKIRFREMKYNTKGVELPMDVSDKEFVQPDPTTKSKDYIDFIWVRRCNVKGKYRYSEVQIINNELQSFFRVEFTHVPRLHFPPDSTKTEFILPSPFEPLINQ